MKTIWKFMLPIQDGIIEVEMPKEAEIVHVGSNLEEVCLWALVETEQEKETRKFRIHGTGHPLPDNAGTGFGTSYRYVGSTVVIYRGPVLVWHVFEVDKQVEVDMWDRLKRLLRIKKKPPVEMIGVKIPSSRTPLREDDIVAWRAKHGQKLKPCRSKQDIGKFMQHGKQLPHYRKSVKAKVPAKEPEEA